jgi:hypothetical protein
LGLAPATLSASSRPAPEAPPPGRRRVLVVSPHFPPTDGVDMHRVRTTIAHYPACGWTPVVLSVRPQAG